MGISAGAVPASFHSIPIGYHGRVSSIGISGQQVRRPMGQSDPNGDGVPIFGPCMRLDYEVELGVYIGTGNALGSPVPLDEAESKLFGLCLLNDWSARDLQSWEMTPLGPFLSKSFATTVSPWIVTMDALAPYRVAWHREAWFPQPLPHLDTSHNRAEGAIDISVALAIEPASHDVAAPAPVGLTKTSFRHQHWTIAQMVAHHTSNGCNLQPGDLIGTGTISGPTTGEAGALMELTEAGRKPVMLGSAPRTFLADGDTVILTASCERPGFARIGFGECRGIVVPAQSAR